MTMPDHVPICSHPAKRKVIQIGNFNVSSGSGSWILIRALAVSDSTNFLDGVNFVSMESCRNYFTHTEIIQRWRNVLLENGERRASIEIARISFSHIIFKI